MDLCWERFGKKWLKPDLLFQELQLFSRFPHTLTTRDVTEHMIICVPLFTIEKNYGLPTLMAGTHRDILQDIPYDLVVQRGHALMFDTRLQRRRNKDTDGGVVLVRRYDITGL